MNTLLIIKPEVKAALLEALAKEVKIEADTLNSEMDDQILMLMEMRFSVYQDDPYEKIREFLKKYGIEFKSDYWVSSR